MLGLTSITELGTCPRAHKRYRRRVCRFAIRGENSILCSMLDSCLGVRHPMAWSREREIVEEDGIEIMLNPRA